ncbi:hypothetical protein [Paraburkholderia sp. RAU2J]|uniref:hypothetical protein n=1 Tax=Paraburkholderia sp. RAU2J TaxID=1938810 RepID=UPI000EAE4A4A|nr:hypothetical protein [Paraburkholderia sp. RAU2J]
MDGLSRTKHWALGAVIAALCSFVYAKAPGMPHGGGGSGHSHAAADHVRLADARNGDRHRDVSAARPGRDSMADRNLRMPQGGANFAGVNYADGFGVYRPDARRVGGPSGYPGDGRGRMQYAGAMTPVSAESRGVPRPPQNAPVRGGSIRADVARYNEERGSARASQRQADDPRQPEGSPYRN